MPIYFMVDKGSGKSEGYPDFATWESKMKVGKWFEMTLFKGGTVTVYVREMSIQRFDANKQSWVMAQKLVDGSLEEEPIKIGRTDVRSFKEIPNPRK